MSAAAATDRTAIEFEVQVLELRREQRRGPDWIGAELGVCRPARSARSCRGIGPRIWRLDPLTGEVIRETRQTAQRYGRSRPGELVHMDVKTLGRTFIPLASISVTAEPKERS